MNNNEVYFLKVQIAEFPKGSIVVSDQCSWYIGNKEFNTRGRIAEGEMCVLLTFLAEKNLTSMLERKGA